MHMDAYTHACIPIHPYMQGVIGVIVPWNYPFHNVLSATVAALMAGNGAVVKVCDSFPINVFKIISRFTNCLVFLY
jgi:acyl-CoA reductase-like NAD-dependent aldehyde dehydrogenase